MALSFLRKLNWKIVLLGILVLFVFILYHNWRDSSIVVDLKIKNSEMEDEYYDIAFKIDAKCPGKSKHFGNQKEGGYQICIDGAFMFKKNECIVYDIRMDNDWKFSDDISNSFNCHVYAFEPSIIPEEDHNRTKNIHFYSIKITGKRKDDSWPLMKTIKEIMTMLNHSDKVIDIIKLDVEISEWDILSLAISDGSLSKVKQLVFKSHNFHSLGVHYDKKINILKSLRDVHMRQWYHKYNMIPTSLGFSKYTGKFRVCCIEHHFINVLSANFANTSSAEKPTGGDDDVMSLDQLDNAYYKAVYKLDAKCRGPQRKYHGFYDDEEYHICMDSNFQFKRNDCIIYDFGINSELSFDDQIIEQYNCKVYSFDYTKKRKNYTSNSNNIYFYNIGVTGVWNRRIHGRKLLKDIIEMLGHRDKDIDLVVLNSPDSIWKVLLSSLQQGSLRRVKQLVFTSQFYGQPGSYLKNLKILNSLRSIPFKQWMYRDSLIQTTYLYNPYASQKRICCVDHSMINTNYIEIK